MDTHQSPQLSTSLSPRRFNQSISSVHEHSPSSFPMSMKLTENEKAAERRTPEKKASAMDGNMYTPEKRHQHPPNWDKITWAPKVSISFSF